MSETYDPEDAPKIPPRPIIVCSRCRRPFDCRRDTKYDWMDSFRCPSCGEWNSPRSVICDRTPIDEYHRRLKNEGESPYTDLYVVRAGEDMVKVGVTNNIENRISSMQPDSPVGLEVVKVFEVDNASGVERAIHDKLADVNRHGEWFELSDRTIESFVDSVELVVENQ